MKRALLAATAAFVAMGAGQALAEGFYIGASAGVNLLSDSDTDQSFGHPFLDMAFTPGTTVDVNSTVENDTGFAIVGALGYQFDIGLRLEAEVGYRRNGMDGVMIDSVGLSGIGSIPLGIGLGLDGHTSSLSVMGNALYEHRFEGGIKPYVGGGVGVSWVSADASIEVPLGGLFGAVNDIQVVDDTAAVFAYQAIAGVGYELDANWTVGVEYRFFGTASPDFDNDLDLAAELGGPPGALGIADVNTEGSYHSHSVMLGIRYTF